MNYWTLTKELDNLRQEFDRIFSDFGAWGLPFSRISFLPARAVRAYPMINIMDDKDNLYVEALAPGVDMDSLDVSVTGNTLTISGEKMPAKEGLKDEAYHRNERAAGKFVRSIELPTPIDEKKVKAVYKNGLLLITLPKAESAKPKRIAITAG